MSTAIIEPATPPSTETALDAAAAYQKERGKPVPGYNHSRTQARLIVLLAGSTQYDILSELNLELNGWRSVPDLCLFPKASGLLREDVSWVTETPAMAVEIFSPTQTMDEMTEKVNKLLAVGVPSVWLVMPAVHVISIFQKDIAPVSVTQGTLTDPATGVTVDVDAVFS